jgi:hypothetical protein
MDRLDEKALYRKIWVAREHCAGSNVAITDHVIADILDAKNYAEHVGAGETIIGKLQKALEIMRTAKSYGDRLPADEILCHILNNDIGD